jgi:hypothetical protein
MTIDDDKMSADKPVLLSERVTEWAPYLIWDMTGKYF